MDEFERADSEFLSPGGSGDVGIVTRVMHYDVMKLTPF